MRTSKNPEELYEAAIRREKQSLLHLDAEIKVALKSDNSVKLMRILYYASVAAAIIVMFLVFNPSGKQDKQLKTFQTMVNNMDFRSASETFKIDIKTTQIDRLNLKIEEMNRDDMINRLNEKMEKYKQQNKQL